MTVAEWSDELQFSTDHAYRLLAAGGVRGAERIGRAWRISRAAWEATPFTTDSEPPAAATAEGSERSTS